MNTHSRKAFTLIELLVVVGILGILSAIALPMYNDAMTKSRIAKVKMDLRTVGNALQSYRVDHNLYPRRQDEMEFFAVYLLPDLTSPISYLHPVAVNDPFGPVEEYEQRDFVDAPAFGPETVPLVKGSYTYVPYVSFSVLRGIRELRKEGFVLSSVGPDRQDSYIVDVPFPKHYRFPGDSVRDSIYNPSNGIQSSGDIGYFGGDIPLGGLLGG